MSISINVLRQLVQAALPLARQAAGKNKTVDTIIDGINVLLIKSDDPQAPALKVQLSQATSEAIAELKRSGAAARDVLRKR